MFSSGITHVSLYLCARSYLYQVLEKNHQEWNYPVKFFIIIFSIECCLCSFVLINKFIWLTLVILIYLLCWYKQQLETFFLLMLLFVYLVSMGWCEGRVPSKLARIILDMGSANERRRYIVTSSLIACGHTKNDPWLAMAFHLILWPINLVSFQAYHEAFDMLFIPTMLIIYVVVCFLFSCVAAWETWSWCMCYDSSSLLFSTCGLVSFDVSLCWYSGPRLDIKTVFPRYGDSHVKDKAVARPSYL